MGRRARTEQDERCSTSIPALIDRDEPSETTMPWDEEVKV